LFKADHQVEERRFSATGLAHDRHHLARCDVKIELFDGHDRLAGRRLPEDLAQLPGPRSVTDRSCPPSQHPLFHPRDYRFQQEEKGDQHQGPREDIGHRE
jgi:hypothetical protein